MHTGSRRCSPRGPAPAEAEPIVDLYKRYNALTVAAEAMSGNAETEAMLDATADIWAEADGLHPTTPLGAPAAVSWTRDELTRSVMPLRGEPDRASRWMLSKLDAAIAVLCDHGGARHG